MPGNLTRERFHLDYQHNQSESPTPNSHLLENTWRSENPPGYRSNCLPNFYVCGNFLRLQNSAGQRRIQDRLWIVASYCPPNGNSQWYFWRWRGFYLWDVDGRRGEPDIKILKSRWLNILEWLVGFESPWQDSFRDVFHVF